MENPAEPIYSPFTCDTFAPRVGETFSLVFHDGSSIDLTLLSAEVRSLNPLDGRALGRSGFVRTDPFVLLFRWIGNVFPQGLYTFRNETMGEFSMSVVPIGPGETGWLYEAVFN